jgi:hypothetical protein
MKKRIIAFIPLCTPLAEVHVEAQNLAPEDLTKILEELEGYTIIYSDAKTIKACKADKFDVLKMEISELLRKGWVWSSR